MGQKNELFQLGCKVGVINTYFGQTSFEKTDLSASASSFQVSDIPKKLNRRGLATDEYVTVSVREAAKALSIGGGQGYIKCNCTRRMIMSLLKRMIVYLRLRLDQELKSHY